MLFNQCLQDASLIGNSPLPPDLHIGGCSSLEMDFLLLFLSEEDFCNIQARNE